MKNNEVIDNTSINEMTLIENMPFSARIKNALIRRNITVLFQLLNMSYDEVFSIRNLGAGACDELVSTLASFGYSLLDQKDITARDNDHLRNSLKQELGEYTRAKKLLEEYQILVSAKADLEVMMDSVIKEFEEIKEAHYARVRK